LPVPYLDILATAMLCTRCTAPRVPSLQRRSAPAAGRRHRARRPDRLGGRLRGGRAPPAARARLVAPHLRRAAGAHRGDAREARRRAGAPAACGQHVGRAAVQARPRAALAHNAGDGDLGRSGEIWGDRSARPLRRRPRPRRSTPPSRCLARPAPSSPRVSPSSSCRPPARATNPNPSPDLGPVRPPARATNPNPSPNLGPVRPTARATNPNPSPNLGPVRPTARATSSTVRARHTAPRASWARSRRRPRRTRWGCEAEWDASSPSLALGVSPPEAPRLLGRVAALSR